MSEPGGNSGSLGRLASLLRTAALVSPPFLLLIGYLVAHRAGWVSRQAEISYERTLILNVLLYWALIVVLVRAWRQRLTCGKWLKQSLPALILMSVSLVVSLGFAEVALRMLRPGSASQPFERLPSDLLHHVNAPDRSSPGMGGALVETNQDGLRSGYSRAEFKAHEQRIALLGDSFLFGLGVAEPDAVGAVLERTLNQQLPANGPAAVLNTGVISYSPYLERSAFRHVVRHYQPTLTMLLIDVNDIGDDHQYSRENVSGDDAEPRFDVPPVTTREPSLCQRSALCRSLDPVWQKLARPWRVLAKMRAVRQQKAYDYYDFQVMVGGVQETNRFFILRHPLADTRPYFERTWGYIRDVAAEVRATGSEFVLVVTPRYFHWNDEECAENWEAHRYGVDEPYENEYLRFFDEKAATADFPIWSLLPEFENSERGPLVFRHDPHWNEAGHAVAGEALASRLLAAGWPQGER